MEAEEQKQQSETKEVIVSPTKEPEPIIEAEEPMNPNPVETSEQTEPEPMEVSETLHEPCKDELTETEQNEDLSLDRGTKRAKKRRRTSGTKEEPRKPRTVPSHPLYRDMILSALHGSASRTGVSRPAILRHVLANYTVEDSPRVRASLRLNLRHLVEDGSIVPGAPRGRRGAGSFKLNPGNMSKNIVDHKPKKEKRKEKEKFFGMATTDVSSTNATPDKSCNKKKIDKSAKKLKSVKSPKEMTTNKFPKKTDNVGQVRECVWVRVRRQFSSRTYTVTQKSIPK